MTEDESQRKGFIVKGRVQGVGFRWSTSRVARELGLSGTVRNRPDGSVEVHVEGREGDVRRLREWLGEGPASAHVREIEEVPSAQDLPGDFRIVR